MRPQAGMYRTPRDPGGFPFGYNWRATGLGLVLLVGFNFLATQYIAAQFRYQPALGTPLVRTEPSSGLPAIRLVHLGLPELHKP